MSLFPHRKEFNFASYQETSEFLREFQKQLSRDKMTGYIVLTGSDNAWKLSDAFKQEARPDDKVRIVCPADEAYMFTAPPEDEIIATAHILPLKYAQIHQRMSELHAIYKAPHNTVTAGERRAALTEAVEMIEDLIRKKLIDAALFEPHHAKINKMLIHMDMINYVDSHYRKIAGAFNEDGPHKVALNLQRESCTPATEAFLRQFTPRH